MIRRRFYKYDFDQLVNLTETSNLKHLDKYEKVNLSVQFSLARFREGKIINDEMFSKLFFRKGTKVFAKHGMTAQAFNIVYREAIAVIRQKDEKLVDNFRAEHSKFYAYIGLYFLTYYPFTNDRDSKFLIQKLIETKHLMTLEGIDFELYETFIKASVACCYAKYCSLLNDQNNYNTFLIALYFYIGIFKEKTKSFGVNSNNIELSKILTPIQKHTNNIKSKALPLAAKIWSYDREHNLLMRRQVAALIVELLPSYDLSVSQVDNWLKHSEIVPSAILNRYERHDYANSRTHNIMREQLKERLRKELVINQL